MGMVMAQLSQAVIWGVWVGFAWRGHAVTCASRISKLPVSLNKMQSVLASPYQPERSSPVSKRLAMWSGAYEVRAAAASCMLFVHKCQAVTRCNALFAACQIHVLLVGATPCLFRAGSCKPCNCTLPCSWNRSGLWAKWSSQAHSPHMGASGRC